MVKGSAKSSVKRTKGSKSVGNGMPGAMSPALGSTGMNMPGGAPAAPMSQPQMPPPGQPY